MRLFLIECRCLSNWILNCILFQPYREHEHVHAYKIIEKCAHKPDQSLRNHELTPNEGDFITFFPELYKFHAGIINFPEEPI